MFFLLDGQANASFVVSSVLLSKEVVCVHVSWDDFPQYVHHETFHHIDI